MVQIRDRKVVLPEEEVLCHLDMPVLPYYPEALRYYWNTPLCVLNEWMTPNSTKGGYARRVRFWKAFSHYKVASAFKSEDLLRPAKVPAASIQYGSSVGGRVDSAFRAFGSAYSSDTGLPQGFDIGYAGSLDSRYIPEPDELADLVLASLKAMVPAIKSRMSLFNSLYELKDFATLGKSIRGIVSAISSVAKLITLQGSGTKTIRELLGAAADSYLQEQFNFKPLLSDMSDVYHSLRDANKQVNRLLANEGRAVTSHYRRDLQERTEKESFVIEGLNGPFTRFDTTVSVRNHASEFRAHLMHRYSLSRWQKENAPLLALLDDLGLDFNPVIIWNAIPWSFVVDWFARLQTVFDSMRIGWMDPQINMLQYCWSISRKREFTVRAEYDLNVGDPHLWGDKLVRQYYTYPTVSETAYRREVVMPDASLFETSGLSLKEFSLAVALGVTRKQHHRKRRRKRR